jgi:hypothetical protein
MCLKSAKREDGKWTELAGDRVMAGFEISRVEHLRASARHFLCFRL